MLTILYYTTHLNKEQILIDVKKHVINHLWMSLYWNSIEND